MGKKFLFVPPVGERDNSHIIEEQSTTLSYPMLEQSLEVDDSLLLVNSKGAAYEAASPVIARVIQVDRHSSTVTLKTEKIYNKKVPIEAVRDILNRTLGVGATLLTQTEFDAIVGRMGGIRLEETELLQHIKHYIAAKGDHSDDETVYNFHICLKTRPFVILAGLSGTGKSKLSQLYAEAMGHTVQNKRYLRLAVRPSWNDDRFLLGYHNSLLVNI